MVLGASPVRLSKPTGVLVPPTRRLLAVLALVPLAVTACSGQEGAEVELFAAASLGVAGDALIAEYQQAHPEINIKATYAGSAQLVTHLQEGATPDLLITADTVSMDRAREVAPQELTGEPTLLASNTLVLATAPGNPAGVDSLEDLGQDGVITALCAPEVPCGRLAAAELDRAQLVPSSATQENSVSAVTTKLATGQADAGFIYTTDAATLEGVQVIPLPEVEPNSYPLALTQRGRGNPAAMDFSTWLLESEQARDILTRHGFTTP